MFGDPGSTYLVKPVWGDSKGHASSVKSLAARFVHYFGRRPTRAYGWNTLGSRLHPGGRAHPQTSFVVQRYDTDDAVFENCRGECAE
jgi:hypothetical protein